MPRKAKDERLDTRTARSKLKPRREPYWRNIQPGRAIGYRRLGGGKGGTWIARSYEPGRGRRYDALGAADDMQDADGAGCLTFAQAQDKAREWFAAPAAPKPRAPVTVAEAWERYREDYIARGGKALGEMDIAVKAHVLPKLGARLLADLTTDEIKSWHRDIASGAARVRSARKAAKPNTRRLLPEDADRARARRSTANNLLTKLKAILNFAHREKLAASDDAWRVVKPFRKVDAPRIRYLPDDEAARLVNACPGDLRLLVTAALLTGCRYQELARLRCADVDLRSGTLAVLEAKGAPRHVVLTEEGICFFEQRILGRRHSDLVLPRADGTAWRKSQQFRPLREACEAARIEPAIGFHILRHTHASRLAMAGAPMQVIAAQLGHADMRITAKHYAHLAPSYVADTIRAAFGPLGIVEGTNLAAARR